MTKPVAHHDRSAALLPIIGRSQGLFANDLAQYGQSMDQIVRDSRFLVIGGAGSIGGAVVRELFVRQPRVLHVVDISENNLAELVRDVRSSMGYIGGIFAPLPWIAARRNLTLWWRPAGLMTMC